MKEEYFKEDNIDKEGKIMLDELMKRFRKRKFEIPVKDTALLILDMQEYFFSEENHAFIPSMKAVSNNIKQLAELFTGKKLPVFFSKHINKKNETGMMEKWWKNLIIEENPMSGIIPQLKSLAKDVIIKENYDAFYNTELKSKLEAENIKNIIISGVMTHLCCETTARMSFINGFNTFFLIDGTATYNREFHMNTLINLSHGFSTCVLVKEVLEAFK